MLKPLNKHIVLDWSKDEETTTDSGIVIPGALKRGEFATVLAVGEESKLSIGSKVLFNKLAGRFVEIDGQNVLLIPESELYGVLV